MAKATNAQVKFVLHVLHKLLTNLLVTCYSNADDINNRNMALVHDTLERMKDLCYDTGEAITVADCIHYLQNWRSDLQNKTMLAQFCSASATRTTQYKRCCKTHNAHNASSIC